MTFQKETMTQAIQSTSAVLIVHATTAYIYTAAKDSARKEVLTMDVREKLVELIGSTEYGNGSLVGNNFQKGFIERKEGVD